MEPGNNNTAEGWDAGADSYAASTHFGAMLEWYSVQALETLGITSVVQKATSPLTLLDIGGGPGTLSIYLGRQIKQLQSENKVPVPITLIASDFAPKFVDITAKRAAKEHLDFITPKILDGQALELDSESVDYAFSAFGLFLFPDRAKGFSEAYRVLKPGGALLITSWTPPMAPMMVLGATMKRLPQPPETQPPAQKPAGMPLSTEEAIQEEMSAAGFKTISITKFGSNWLLPHSEFIAFVQTNPMLSGLRNRLGEDKLTAAVQSTLTEEFPEPCTLPATAYVSIGWKL
eukprot:TRINITY_DN11594_c0_g1_i1.p1 TRINITY_DN11594_c0_g1~~TRINITY_DN11594_c0_g1_i1.p1  ORF type:complete len:303 (-),score=49.01 TRINITY_DN11594_c0_g1_i1:64-930(-)